MLKFAAPNRHIDGNCVLCLFLVQHGCPKAIYCWEFCHVKYTSFDVLHKLAGHVMLCGHFPNQNHMNSTYSNLHFITMFKKGGAVV